MTIDERIERLTERHEALAQSVELLTHSLQRHDDQIGKIISAIGQDSENIRALSRIAEAHQKRIEHLEDQAQ
jgi:archaellum component FlaC